ncbi:hypothetical protein FJV41_23595 [Myxococcus llanfairpwllgwyngyllgogerychwyrndrobwllllantysiliogogogochensis]|uniref:Lipoprotein n=1 Tax=Myxococcus llanfairpwllgwyngyllgogerychwyrndrobwllllantysiliogogogochensis TaxID=2590453 RepID=A0A540WWX7_9BACT|nr:hypothetical protein [Myxococcus llanfairpwllgwyngyllgogerychwyrndrobwllllantysiliogogogochensis]TQF13507.1 hypothetical protein FJV41_23595 [Myxococcus llanfairpwllgwyngyllgogerychwyrndrobwllllantysiliogogogochensis]
MKKLNLSALLLTLLVAACGGSSGTGLDDVPESEGVIQVPLITTGTGGQTFRLVGATFDITGPKNHTITDTSADTVAVQLPAGGYTIQLQGEWHIERVGAPGQSIPATLISPNPLSFTVAEGEARTVRFLFKTPAEGTTDVGFSVDTGGWLAGTLDFTNSPHVPESEFYVLGGKTVPFAISFESAQVRQDNDSSFGSHLVVTTSPVSVQFGGAYSSLLNERVARALSGKELNFLVTSGGPTGGLRVRNLAIRALGAEPLDFLMFDSAIFPGYTDAMGFPLPGIYQVEGLVTLGNRFGEQIPGTLRATLSPK